MTIILCCIASFWKKIVFTQKIFGFYFSKYRFNLYVCFVIIN